MPRFRKFSEMNLLFEDLLNMFLLFLDLDYIFKWGSEKFNKHSMNGCIHKNDSTYKL